MSASALAPRNSGGGWSVSPAVATARATADEFPSPTRLGARLERRAKAASPPPPLADAFPSIKPGARAPDALEGSQWIRPLPTDLRFERGDAEWPQDASPSSSPDGARSPSRGSPTGRRPRGRRAAGAGDAAHAAPWPRAGAASAAAAIADAFAAAEAELAALPPPPPEGLAAPSAPSVRRAAEPPSAQPLLAASAEALDADFARAEASRKRRGPGLLGEVAAAFERVDLTPPRHPLNAAAALERAKARVAAERERVEREERFLGATSAQLIPRLCDLAAALVALSAAHAAAPTIGAAVPLPAAAPASARAASPAAAAAARRTWRRPSTAACSPSASAARRRRRRCRRKRSVNLASPDCRPTRLRARPSWARWRRRRRRRRAQPTAGGVGGRPAASSAPRRRRRARRRRRRSGRPRRRRRWWRPATAAGARPSAPCSPCAA